jgi:L-2-hydroxyglutarate oxidase
MTRVVVVGGGILGLSTAYALGEQRPDWAITILEKEPTLAAHQTGHNSGVIHSGLYYRPGSLKARLTATGRVLLQDFCTAQDVEFEVCGKVVVATTPAQHRQLEVLIARGKENGVPLEPISVGELAGREPHVRGVAAIHVPSTGIVDYQAVCAALGRVLESRGVEIRLSSPVLALEELDKRVVVVTEDGSLSAAAVVACAGLQADRVARSGGIRDLDVQIVPFRGEYYQLVASRRSLIQNLVYPVPDPTFPFLGVHFTRGIDHSVHAGPNAVLALAREGYRRSLISGPDMRELLSFPGTWRLMRKHWRAGASELHRSLRRRSFLHALQNLVPDIRDEDLVPAPAGVRAQAVGRDGRLVDDFVLEETSRVVHILNAPSPAATASFAIGRVIASSVIRRLG